MYFPQNRKNRQRIRVEREKGSARGKTAKGKGNADFLSDFICSLSLNRFSPSLYYANYPIKETARRKTKLDYINYNSANDIIVLSATFCISLNSFSLSGSCTPIT